MALHYSLRHESLGSGGELVLPASVCAGTMLVACLTGGAIAAGGSVSRGGGGAGVAPEAVSPAPHRDPSSAGTSPGPRANLRPRRHTPDFVPLLARHCRPSLPQAGAVRQAGPVEADVQEMRCQDALRIKLPSRSQEPELPGASGGRCSPAPGLREAPASREGLGELRERTHGTWLGLQPA